MANAVDAKTLDESTLLEIYGKMVLSRTLDERIWMLNRQGKAAIMASSQGHEAAQIGSVYALKRGTDQFYIYYPRPCRDADTGHDATRNHAGLHREGRRTAERR